MGLRYATHRKGGDIINKALGNSESILAGIKLFFTKIKAYAGIAERLVRDLAIEKALQYEIKDTLEHSKQSCVNWCDLSDKGKKKNNVKLTVTYDMVWQKR